MLNKTRSRFFGAARRRTGAVVACASVLALTAACTNGGGIFRRTTTTRASGGSGATLDTVNYMAEYQRAKASGQTPWWCKSEGLGGHMDHGDQHGLAHDVYAGMQKGTLSDADCQALSRQFDQIIQKVKPYKTRGDGRRAGLTQLVQHVDGMGTHDTVRGVSTMQGPPAAPFFLQYDGESDSAPLAGMSWFVMSGQRPPAGFPGNNDWWHTHATLCFTGLGTVKGNEIEDQTCEERGGLNIRLPGAWMSHAWIVPGWENKYDVFSGAYMCLRGTGRPPAENDPCRDDRTDPEHSNGNGHSATTTTRGGGSVTTRPSGGNTTTTMGHGDHQH